MSKASKVTFVSAPSVTTVFASVAEMTAAFNRVAAFGGGLVGSEACPLLLNTVTVKQIEKAQKALDKHRDEGGDDAEFDMSVFDRIWSSSIPSGFLDQVTEDIQKIVATWELIVAGKGGLINGWNYSLKVKGFTLTARQAIGAVIGDGNSKISFKDILKAMR
jgi:hypothetical protein